jgi:hypothetical protein
MASNSVANNKTQTQIRFASEDTVGRVLCLLAES